MASRVANKQSKEAAEGEFRGHWNARGEKPYHRYAYAGGKDHVTENASAMWIQGRSFDGTLETYLKLMTERHQSFMGEMPPHDGHKQAVIQKAHNYVGIGCFMTETQFRYYEEFVDRHAKIGEVPRRVKSGQEFIVSITPNDGLFLCHVVAFYEQVPKAMSRDEINRKHSYRDFTDDADQTLTARDLARLKNDDGQYFVPFTFRKEGLYYITMWVDESDPVVNMGRTVVTGIVVEVQ